MYMYAWHRPSKLLFLQHRLKMVQHYRLKLQIWGKAQRESAQRPKSDWGKLEGRLSLIHI